MSYTTTSGSWVIPGMREHTWTAAKIVISKWPTYHIIEDGHPACDSKARHLPDTVTAVDDIPASLQCGKLGCYIRWMEVRRRARESEASTHSMEVQG
jgi:hypothetical protein